MWGFCSKKKSICSDFYDFWSELKFFSKKIFLKYIHIFYITRQNSDHYGDIIDRHLCKRDWKKNNNNSVVLKNSEENLSKKRTKLKMTQSQFIFNFI